ncbi:MAG TPA: hypothetical protein VF429_06360 [Anaerolineae bacterium]|jgi:hypothetical protein
MSRLSFRVLLVALLLVLALVGIVLVATRAPEPMPQAPRLVPRLAPS